MTLLITVFAAAASTIIWYCSRGAREIKVGTLCFLYWGASLMWLVDAFFEYAELKAAYFAPSLEDMANDTFLGLSVVALGLVIWIIVLMVRDPKGAVREFLLRK